MVQKRACDACHKRKIQCDSTSSDKPCNWCDHHGLACTFDRVRGRKKKAKIKAKLSVEQSLSDRLGRIEDVLARTIARQDNNNNNNSPSSSSTTTPAPPPPPPPPPPSGPIIPLSASGTNPISLGEQFAAYDSIHSPFISTPNSAFSTSVSFGQIHYAGRHLGQISSHNGMPVLSENGQRWISARTGEDVSFSKFHRSYQTRHNPPNLFPRHFYSSTSEVYEMPDRAMVDKVAAVFCSSAFRLVFPIIDRFLFEDTVAVAYEEFDGLPSYQQISAKCCVFAFLSIMGLFQSHVPELPDVDGDSCAVKAHYMLPDVFEDASLVSLQTVFMLNMQESFSGRLQSASMLHAIACRHVFMLGGHTYKVLKPYGTDATHREREARHLRTLFWLCYIFDKDIALRTGQPPLMSDDYCDLTLPDNYMDCYFYPPEIDKAFCTPSLAFKEVTPHLPGDPRLSHLKDRTCRLLYSTQAQKKSDAEILRDIRELDDELESWRISIPPEFRPALSITDKTQIRMENMTLPRSMRNISLHLEYHHLMTTIHRASERCYALQAENGKENDWNVGVQSSIALSLEASRSTLVYLKAAVSGLAGEAFWMVVFYPTAAVMTLFLHILVNPLHSQTGSDIELLSSASDLVRNMPIRRLAPQELRHIKLVNEFVDEVIRLSHCAIQKAKLEQR